MRTEAPEVIAGRYRLISRISSGGMGDVLLARDEVLAREVAIKVLPKDLSATPSFVERFRAEALAAARLNQRNVVQVYDSGVVGATYFIVMEYVRGKNLREVINSEGKLHPAHASEIVAQILDGLDAAHTRGLVHRDVKATNVLVGIDGTVKVTDFGIARAAEGGTPTGGLYGTVGYVAPEQARAEMVDGRADVYSAGCLLFEVLTGGLPFQGDAAAVLNSHLTGRVPPPSDKDPAVPPDLDRIVLRATEPDPNDRYPSAGAMAAALRSGATKLGTAPPVSELVSDLTSEIALDSSKTLMPAPGKRRRPWRLILVALLMAMVATMLALFRPVRVPEILGMERGGAEQQLSELAFKTSVTLEFSDYPSGRVISADPSPGDLTFRGSTVALVISKGPQLTNLPSLLALTLDDARRIIVEADLVTGNITDEYSRAPAGEVIRQDPQPGRVRVNTPVNLVVSKGPEMVEVPDVLNLGFQGASARLGEVGLIALRNDVFGEAPPGTVLSQTPPPGTQAEKGSEVLLYVSKGPEPFAMPDVKGKPCSEARSILEGQGLVVVVRAQSGSCATNKILDQDPLPGAKVKKGDEATLYAG